jgi:hypothetical protein
MAARARATRLRHGLIGRGYWDGRRMGRAGRYLAELSPLYPLPPALLGKGNAMNTLGKAPRYETEYETGYESRGKRPGKESLISTETPPVPLKT